ncbi:hypothetical protein X770_20415 [Mesorhizobium sp. LSJC269B00]|nr:hypothetical protein X770_20415 [Mesorhizobium sp. LSJC269B00]
MLTSRKVAPSGVSAPGISVNVQTTVVGGSLHCMTIFLFSTISLTLTIAEAPYMRHSQRTSLPPSSRPLLWVNQNFVVMAGLTIASKTSATGRLISMPASAVGVL